MKYVSYGRTFYSYFEESHNQRQLFYCIALVDWFYVRDARVYSAVRTKGISKIRVGAKFSGPCGN